MKTKTKQEALLNGHYQEGSPSDTKHVHKSLKVEGYNLDEVLNILCLEDSPKDAEIISESLIDAGYEIKVDLTDKENEFVSFLRSKKYDLILSDFRLPGFDGFKALKWAMEICPDVPFICVSGTFGEEIAVELLKQGAVDYVLKNHLDKLPFAIDRTLREVKEKKERKRVEKELKNSEEKYHSIFENIQDVYYETSLDGTILEVSPSIEVISRGQYHRVDCIGKSMYEFYTDTKSRDAVISEIQKTGSVTDFEVRLRNRDSMFITCSISAKIILDAQGQPEKIIGSMHDITRRKQSEEELQFHNIILSTQMEASIDGILIVDQFGKIISYNQQFLEIWDVLPALLEKNAPISVLGVVMEKMEDAESFLKQVQYLYEHNLETSRNDIVFKDGRTFDRYSAQC